MKIKTDDKLLPYPASAIEHMRGCNMGQDYMVAVHGQAVEEILKFCEQFEPL